MLSSLANSSKEIAKHHFFPMFFPIAVLDFPPFLVCFILMTECSVATYRYA